MTVAQKTALEKRLEDLQKRIKEILREHRRPLSLKEIELLLRKSDIERIERGEPLDPRDSENTVDVRDAIARMRRAGEVEETLYRDVQLVGE